MDPDGRRRSLAILGILFAVVYFVQGIGEPTDGLIAQPVQALVRRDGAGPAELARFAALASIPWTLKPLYGLVIDLVPLGRSRHRGWLALATAIAGAATLALALWPSPRGTTLLALVIVPTFAVAIADVAADALMVERGAPLGATGVLQSVQWTSIYAASIVNGELGGRLTAAHREDLAFALCAGLSLASSAVVILGLRVRGEMTWRGDGTIAAEPRPSRRELARALRSRRLMGAFAFLFLLAFNPFSSAVQYGYVVGELGVREEMYGRSISVGAVASMIASALYGVYCRRLSPRVRGHGSVVLAIAATLPYAWIDDASSLLVASAVASAAYATTSLVQMDLAAQACPPSFAGTTFAALMAISNAGLAAGTWCGGELWAVLEPIHGPATTYTFLVLAGAAATALGWLALPWALAPEEGRPLS